MKIFESPVETVQEGISLSLEHGLGGTPQFIRAVLVNRAADASFNPGDEIDLTGLGEIDQTNPIFTMAANATHVFLNIEDLYNSGTDIWVRTSANASRVPLDMSSIGDKWGVKVYAFRHC